MLLYRSTRAVYPGRYVPPEWRNVEGEADFQVRAPGVCHEKASLEVHDEGAIDSKMIYILPVDSLVRRYHLDNHKPLPSVLHVAPLITRNDLKVFRPCMELKVSLSTRHECTVAVGLVIRSGCKPSIADAVLFR